MDENGMENAIYQVHGHQTQKRGFSSIASHQRHAMQYELSETLIDTRKRIRRESTVEVWNKSPDEEGLCSFCSQLDLPGIFQKPFQLRLGGPLESHWYDHSMFIADVGNRYRKLQESNCPLCQMFFTSRMRVGEQEGEENGEGDEIRATPFLPLLNLKRRRLMGDYNLFCLLVVPRNNSWFKNLRVNPISNGCAVLLRGMDHSSLFAPRVVPSLFDPRTVETWLDYCKRHHKLLCGLESTHTPGFQVIDCNTLCIEEVKSVVHYVALSYVWGISGTTCEVVRNTRGERRLPKQLPQVIHDSIEVTKALGYQYLWIDKFCIDQDDPSIKHDQIQQMDTVYQNSALTIVAAAGTDEAYGLPGVGGRHRTQQPIARLKDVTVIWSMKDPQQLIASSHWSSRGWTYQEAVLSCRRLVFTDAQVYFECNTMNCFESHHSPLDRLHVKNKSKTYEYLRAGIFGGNREERFGKLRRDNQSINYTFCQYLSNVETYSARNLRYDEDALNAFQGIIRWFSKQTHGLRNIWGLSFPDNSDHETSYLVYSLTWRHKDGSRARRRQIFPTWTWVGWEGEVEYKLVSGSRTPFTNRVQALWFEHQETGNIIPPGELIRMPQEIRNYTFLHITGLVVPPEYISYQPKEDKTWPWVIAEHKAKLSLSCHETSDLQLAGTLEDTSTWQCVYIGAVVEALFIMLLKLNSINGTWERVGIFYTKSVKAVHKILDSSSLGTLRIE
ncbi:heterokaryon incompatibility protein-domain-containing protein [Xylaria curta]|nr:heterokaryon incompatibility protein-domain-containing protein [Xylaria curta]